MCTWLTPFLFKPNIITGYILLNQYPNTNNSLVTLRINNIVNAVKITNIVLLFNLIVLCFVRSETDKQKTSAYMQQYQDNALKMNDQDWQANFSTNMLSKPKVNKNCQYF